MARETHRSHAYQWISHSWHGDRKFGHHSVTPLVAAIDLLWLARLAWACLLLRLYEMRPEERASLGEDGRKYFMAHYYSPDRVAELTAHFEELVAYH